MGKNILTNIDSFLVIQCALSFAHFITTSNYHNRILLLNNNYLLNLILSLKNLHISVFPIEMLWGNFLAAFQGIRLIFVKIFFTKEQQHYNSLDIFLLVPSIWNIMQMWLYAEFLGYFLIQWINIVGEGIFNFKYKLGNICTYSILKLHTFFYRQFLLFVAHTGVSNAAMHSLTYK